MNYLYNFQFYCIFYTDTINNQHYTIMIRNDTVLSVGDSIGINNISQLAVDRICNAANTYITDIINNSVLYVRHTYRKKLIVDDINQALKHNNIEPLYGYSNNNNIQYYKYKHTTNVDNTQYNKDKDKDNIHEQDGSTQQPKQEDIYYISDRIQNLNDIINAKININVPDTTLCIQWLAIDGYQPDSIKAQQYNNINNNVNHMFGIMDNSINNDITNTTAKNQDNQTKRRRVDNTNANNNNILDIDSQSVMQYKLTNEQQLYYNYVTQAIENYNNIDLLSIVLYSISNDNGIQPILPYLIYYINNNVYNSLNNTYYLLALMYLTKSIVYNKNLHIEPYLHQLLPSIMTCILHNKLSTNTVTDNHYELRNISSGLISYICHIYGIQYSNLQPRITYILLNTLLDTTKSLNTHYGCIVTLTQLGNNIIKTLLLPYIVDYIKLINPIIENNDIDNRVKQYEAVQVKYALLQAVSKVLSDSNSSNSNNKDKQSITTENQTQVRSSVALQDTDDAINYSLQSNQINNTVTQQTINHKLSQSNIQQLDATIDLSWNELYDCFGASLLCISKLDQTKYTTTVPNSFTSYSISEVIL